MGYRKGLDSREAIVDAAARVVLQRGFDATSFGDVCDMVGISRGKLTHHFPTKEALFEAITEDRFNRFRRRVIDPLLDESRDPRERILGLFASFRTVYADPERIPGCYIGHTAMELASRTPTMNEQLSRVLDEWRSAVARTLVAAGRPPDAAARLAFLTISAIEGAILMARAQADKSTIVETLNELERILLSPLPALNA